MGKDLRQLNKMIAGYKRTGQTSTDLMRLVYGAYMLALDGTIDKDYPLEEAEMPTLPQCPECSCPHLKTTSCAVCRKEFSHPGCIDHRLCLDCRAVHAAIDAIVNAPSGAFPYEVIDGDVVPHCR